MLILTTSAKTLDFEHEFQVPIETQPVFLNEAAELVETLKKKTRKELAELMEVSDELAAVNYERFKKWDVKHSLENSRPAIVAYQGDIFRQIHENTYSEQQSKYMQDSLRIISGLYGLVRPYDLIQQYRLEMKTPVKTAHGNDLYEFWGDKLTDFLNKEIEAHPHEVIVNLASGEYSKVIKTKELKAPMITIEFYQKKGTEVQSIGLLNKKARGMMIDFMVINQVYDIKQLESFDTNGYKFSAKTPDSLQFTGDYEGVTISKNK
jgi:cytoplasmic iron level regulating protein YaaA (DUF328/UPF0246 family)